MELTGQHHAPDASPPRKKPQYPLDRRLGGPESVLDAGVKEKNSQSLPGLEPQSVAQRYTTELSRLLVSEIEKNTPLIKRLEEKLDNLIIRFCF
jgi:hypothetical protein